MEYLFVFAQYSVLLTKEHVYGSFVVILQRGPHHQVIEAIAVQIRDGSQRRTKARILATIMDFQWPLKDEAILWREGKEYHNETSVIFLLQSSLGQKSTKIYFRYKKQVCDVMTESSECFGQVFVQWEEVKTMLCSINGPT